MKLARHDRSLTAWVLYASILFSLFACGIHHGQMSGSELNGSGGLFCSVDNHSAAGLDRDSGDSKSPSLMPSLGCPLCSAFTLSIALLFCLSWLMRPTGTTFAYREQRGSTSPRFTWPPANPRAP
ncbi:DUF2946 domain-containing protein [Pseudomonas fluorescens]|uniref:DUF2946 domain-containing protein n=1 Tax=Pseudomonas fluorescens TaxID=294 RepID=A0A5E7EGV0_PSEFL|nr:DUF2946 domain-containing protein [Pseudomonas fluorescens]VVO25832.1 hypothetical protein PS691_04548 [Pseudomonas fluorescens]